MTVRVLRAYADTSVFGGAFDPEFADASRMFFEQVERGQFELITSAVVQAEIEPAPPEVREFFDRALDWAEVVDMSDEALRLRRAYLDAEILDTAQATDALHVALASSSACGLIVSWNFRHIVHFDKVHRYNAVNVLNGFAGLAIHSPREVVTYEDENI